MIRDNVIQNNGGILVGGTSANVIVQGNTIQNSDVGIFVTYTSTQGGIMLLDNVEPPGILPNFNPYASN